ncbi:MAG: hypothetical protein K0Q73_8118, partial [Paenibacillus sp.]|nr:hypothetical protein [Paenibacillus sp.]
FPDHIEYTLCAANDKSTRSDSWWQNEKGTQRVLNEIQGLIYYTRARKIIDFVIQA